MSRRPDAASTNRCIHQIIFVMITYMLYRTGNLHAVAKAAGVSAMTVSRTLRNSPAVHPSTRERILKEAKRLGYRPDPVASRLMATVRKGKTRKASATIAFVRDLRPAAVERDAAHLYIRLDDIRSRATVLGYNVDEFILGKDGVSPRRLQSILRARGIEAALFSLESPHRHLEGFDFSSFACATFGYGLQNPALHRASTNMTQGLLAGLDWLASRGYARIGLAVSAWADIRSDHTYSGAFRHYQATVPRRRQVPPLIFETTNLHATQPAFLKWLKTHRPDALISFDKVIPDWVTSHAGLAIPSDIGFLVHDHPGNSCGLSGVCHNRIEVAAAAVDLVTTQLFHNERGIPRVPRQILVPATLLDQGSCPGRS